MDFKNWLKLEEQREKLTKSQRERQKLASINPPKSPQYKPEVYN
jgi:hypothetical protein